MRQSGLSAPGGTAYENLLPFVYAEIDVKECGFGL